MRKKTARSKLGHVFGPRALIESVPIAGNRTAKRDIEIALRKICIVRGSEWFLAYREDEPFERKGAESYGAVFSVTVGQPNGYYHTRRVYAKAIVSGFGADGTNARITEEIRRLRTLRRWGIRTPFMYGTGKGTLYRRYLQGNWKDDLERLRNGSATVRERRRYIGQLGSIAATLDFRGAHTLDFISDLWTDGSLRLFYIDGGFDLGHVSHAAPPDPARPARKTLEKYFGVILPRDLEQWYETCYTRLSALKRRRR